jgi:TonB family protein
MERIYGSVLFAAAVIGSLLMPFVLWAQDAAVKDIHVLPSGFVMKFTRMGGYAGVYDAFWIYPDGRVINTLGKTAKIPPEIVGQWLKTIAPHAGTPLSDALADTSAELLCFDCFVYLITIYDEDGTKTLKFSGPLKGSDDVAKTFSGIRDRLQGLVWSPLMGAPIDAEERSRIIKRQPIKIIGNIQQSKLIYRVDPVYPELAKRDKLSGRVVLLVTVNEEGLVADVTVGSGDPILAGSAVTAVKQWRYSPTLLNVEPVPVAATITMIFSFTASGDTAISVGE